MKTRSIARGIVGSVAALLGVMAAGCSADVAPGDSAEIGSSEQGLQIYDPSVSVQFSGYAKLPGTSLVLSVGGYNQAGNGVTTSGIISSTGFTALSNALPDALGEVEVSLVENDTVNSTMTFLVAGGRTAKEANASTKTYLVTLSGAGFTTATWLTSANGIGQLSTGRVIGLHNLQQCGSSPSKQIAIGGVTAEGMNTRSANTHATASIEVFTYSKNGMGVRSGSWALLKDASNNTVTLQDERGYHQVLHVSDTDFVIAGGMSNSVNLALDTVEHLTVTSACVSNNDGVANQTPSLNNMPGARARAASIAKSVSYALSGQSSVTYDFVLAGGNANAVGAPTDIFFYKASSDTWEGTKADLGVGRIFPRFADNASNGVILGTGILPSATNLFDTTTPKWSKISTAAAVTNSQVSPGTPTDLATDRVGSVVSEFGASTPFAAFGGIHSASVTSTGMATDVESF